VIVWAYEILFWYLLIGVNLGALGVSLAMASSIQCTRKELLLLIVAWPYAMLLFIRVSTGKDEEEVKDNDTHSD